jgi:hypothetical protein
MSSKVRCFSWIYGVAIYCKIPYHVNLLFLSSYFCNNKIFIGKKFLNFNRTWRVHDTPTQMSLDQLNRMKYILLTHVDEECKCTSVAKRYTKEDGNVDWSVARDLQSSNGNQIYKCTRDDYDETWEWDKSRKYN